MIKTLLKFHLMIVRSVGLQDLILRCSGWYYARTINERYFELPFSEFITRNVKELVAGGALLLQDGNVVNKD